MRENLSHKQGLIKTHISLCFITSEKYGTHHFPVERASTVSNSGIFWLIYLFSRMILQGRFVRAISLTSGQIAALTENDGISVRFFKVFQSIFLRRILVGNKVKPYLHMITLPYFSMDC